MGSTSTTLWGFPCCARLPCVRAAATTLIAATQVMQLVQGRGEKGEARKASLVFTAAEAVVITAVVKKFEGQTEVDPIRGTKGRLS